VLKLVGDHPQGERLDAGESFVASGAIDQNANPMAGV
jgi:hypothetical protein